MNTSDFGANVFDEPPASAEPGASQPPDPAARPRKRAPRKKKTKTAEVEVAPPGDDESPGTPPGAQDVESVPSAPAPVRARGDRGDRTVAAEWPGEPETSAGEPATLDEATDHSPAENGEEGEGARRRKRRRRRRRGGRGDEREAGAAGDESSPRTDAEAADKDADEFEFAGREQPELDDAYTHRGHAEDRDDTGEGESGGDRDTAEDRDHSANDRDADREDGEAEEGGGSGDDFERGGGESDPQGRRRRRRRRGRRDDERPREERTEEPRGPRPGPHLDGPVRAWTPRHEDRAVTRPPIAIPTPEGEIRGARIAVLIDLDFLDGRARARDAEIAWGRVIAALGRRRHVVRAIAYATTESGERMRSTLLGNGVELQTVRSAGALPVAIAVDAMSLASRVDAIVLIPPADDLAPIARAVQGQGVRLESADFIDAPPTAESIVQGHHRLGEECLFEP